MVPSGPPRLLPEQPRRASGRRAPGPSVYTLRSPLPMALDLIQTQDISKLSLGHLPSQSSQYLDFSSQPVADKDILTKLWYRKGLKVFNQKLPSPTSGFLLSVPSCPRADSCPACHQHPCLRPGITSAFPHDPLHKSFGALAVHNLFHLRVSHWHAPVCGTSPTGDLCFCFTFHSCPSPGSLSVFFLMCLWGINSAWCLAVA